LGKCLSAGVRVLLLDEPTRGVDVEAKAQIYALLRSLAEEGISIIVVSSEIEELFYMCDRLLILGHGEKIAERSIDQTTPVETMTIAMEGVAA
jgi:ABC-type sugar transport system ATPase subunit